MGPVVAGPGGGDLRVRANGVWPDEAVVRGGLRCEVAAASKLQRPAGDRGKTDARDALHLARLLRLDEVTSVRVPTLVEESARDLTRCREAARADLMRARHRLSKLPYRPTGLQRVLRRRWELAPPAAVARAQAGNHRLHHRWVSYAERRKRPVIANVAVARELAGWCWSLATLPD